MNGTQPAVERRAEGLVEEGLALHERGLGTEALSCFARALEAESTPAVASRAHRGSARVHTRAGRWREAARALQLARLFAEDSGDGDLVAEAYNGRGMLHHTRGRLERAAHFYERGLVFAHTPRVRGSLLQNLGSIAASQQDFDTADVRFSESEENFRAAGYSRGLAIGANNRAAIALDRCDFQAARESAEGAVEAARAVGDFELLSIALVNLADAFYNLGRVAESEAAVAEAFGQLTMQSNPWRRAQCLQIMGNVRRELGYPLEARRCYEMGIAVLEAARVVGHSDPLRVSLRRLLEEMDTTE